MGNIGTKKDAAKEAASHIDATALYNALNQTHPNVLVLDVRADATDGDKIDSAILASPEESQDTMVAAIETAVTAQRMRKARLVVVGEAGQTIPSEVFRAVASANRRVADEPHVGEICLLEGGYSGFKREFGMMTTGDPRYIEGRLYPSLVFEQGGHGKPLRRVFVSNYGLATWNHTYQALSIGYVVNCTPDIPFADIDGLKTHRVPVVDTVEEGDKFVQLLPATLEFIHDAMSQEDGHENILVHCKHGQSRSVGVVVAYLMAHHDMTFSAAHDFIRLRRPQASTKFQEPLERWSSQASG
mmetsp:Transcript_12143/g.34236  ORF Transcript_12143/g.34236 Transcript_12143/m.34236 type:complete len:300 (+) Transcript_12143:173-1072(+)